MSLRAYARSSGLSRMVIWPVSPRSKSRPARRMRCCVGSARCSTASGSGRALADLGTRGSNRLLCLVIFPPGPVDIYWRLRRRRRRAHLMCRAIGRTLQRLRPAEEEVAGTGIADRPTAVIAGQFEQRATLRERNVRVETGVVDIRLGFDHPDRRQPLLAQRDAADEKCNHPLRDATFVSSTPLAVRPGIGREPSNPEPMDFSHHRAVTE